MEHQRGSGASCAGARWAFPSPDLAKLLDLAGLRSAPNLTALRQKQQLEIRNFSLYGNSHKGKKGEKDVAGNSPLCLPWRKKDLKLLILVFRQNSTFILTVTNCIW